MKKSFLIILFSLMTNYIESQSFKAQQLKFERVRKAYSQKENILINRYKKAGIESLSTQILLRAFKASSELELWAFDTKTNKFLLVYTYKICEKSGSLGPKRAFGDEQVPEGFYQIERYNPMSNFYVSLGINYPNISDRILGEKEALGGDIFIHGNCMTIGCIPITDEFIKEVYIACVEAKNSGQVKIPVHIFPFRMETIMYKKMAAEYLKNTTLITFWNNLKQGYTFFEKNKTVPTITIDKHGLYIFK